MASDTAVQAGALDELLGEVDAFHGERSLRLKGLSALELAALESSCGGRFPACLRTVLLRVGLLTNPFRMLGRGTDWAASRKWLERVPGGEHLVAFEDDGSDDYWALARSDDEGRDVFFVDHDAATSSRTSESFVLHLTTRWHREREWLQQCAGREWTIQFSFEGEHDATLVALTRALGGEVVVEWADERKPLQVMFGPLQASSKRDGVPPNQAVLLVEGRRFVVERSSYGALQSSLHVDVTDPEARIDDGFVEVFRRAIRDAGLRCVEVDYGLRRRGTSMT